MRSRPGAGVDVAASGRSRQRAVGAAEVLREHQVPDLDVAVLRRRVGRAAVGAELRAVVVEDLRATDRTDRSRPSPRSCPCRGAGCARGARPTASAQMSSASSSSTWHGDPDPVAVDAEHLGDELPRPRDGLGLEVVAEAEVAEHLEEATGAGASARWRRGRCACRRRARTSGSRRPAAAAYGTGSSPRKYGTNGIIPELVNIGADGCVGIRLAEGTSGVRHGSTKNSVQARRSSSAVVAMRRRGRHMGRPALPAAGPRP